MAGPPVVGITRFTVDTTDGILPVNLDGFVDADRAKQIGLDVASLRFRASEPPPEYAFAGLEALYEACVELSVPEARIAFVEAVRARARPGFAGFYAAEFPDLIFIVTSSTRRPELRANVRHELAHLAYRTEHGDYGGGHIGPSEDFALAFESDGTVRPEDFG